MHHKWPIPKTNFVGTDASGEQDTLESDDCVGSAFCIAHLGQKPLHPFRTDIEVSGKILPMEIDTGASVSIISEQSQKHIFPQEEVGVSQLQLETYTGEKLTMKGQMQVVVGYKSQEKNLVLHVVAGEGPTLMGRDWLKHIQLDWQIIGKIQAQHPIGNLQEILNR